MVEVKVKTIELVRLQRMLAELDRWGAALEACELIDSWLVDPARQLAPEPHQISVRFAAVSTGAPFRHNGVAYRKTSTTTATPAESPLPPLRFRAGDVVEIDR